MFCEFETNDGLLYICNKCGISLYSTDGQPPIFVCKSHTSQMIKESTPSFIDKIKNFVQATKEHIKSGAKLADDKTIEQRYSTCQTCEFFIKQSCSKCGCPIFANKKYISKLSWAEQGCPVNKWGPEIT